MSSWLPTRYASLEDCATIPHVVPPITARRCKTTVLSQRSSKPGSYTEKPGPVVDHSSRGWFSVSIETRGDDPLGMTGDEFSDGLGNLVNALVLYSGVVVGGGGPARRMPRSRSRPR
jgi:hypothetical protein